MRMTYFLRKILYNLCVLLLVTPAIIPATAQTSAELYGRVIDSVSSEPLPFINVGLKGTRLGASTDNQGNFRISNIPPGTYTIVFSAIGYAVNERRDVVLKENDRAQLDAALSPSDISLAEVSVYGASLRRERITEAPAAVSVIDPAEIKLNSTSGQLPRLLEAQPGVDVVQSGIQDFNINTRGFNSSLNRRLLVLMDGRDIAIAFLGAQEWNGLTVPLEDLGRLELVRGPGSALYGPNAFNGVINVSTPPPKDVLGTKFSYSLGELNTVRTDVRQASILGNGWSYKANFGTVSSGTWSKSRTAVDTNAAGNFEYAGLRSAGIERRPLSNEPVSSIYGSGRIDFDFNGNDLVTAEAGLSRVQNELFVTGIGRVQVTEAEKPWGRLSYNSERLNVNLWGQGRHSVEPQYSLASGAPLLETSQIYHAEAQYNFSPVADMLRVIVGASHRYYHVDTDGTLMAAAHYDNTSGIFGQAEYSPFGALRLIAATRWDRSTLHSDQWSPKGAVVWTPGSNHSVRATINKAFQVPNYSEKFLQAIAGFADLRAFGGTGTDPVYARGNNGLSVEKITGYEIGYRGIFLNNKLFFSLDAYFNRAIDFVTDLLPGVNPDYAFNPPPGFPAGLADIARANGIYYQNGRPQVVYSYTNAGKVDERGTEMGIIYYINDELHFDGTWTWYDFAVKEQQIGDILLPNAPRHKFSFGGTYRSRAGYELSLTGRNIQPFRWAAGVFQGDIPPYTLLNLSAGYQITRQIRLNGTISNLLNHRVYQIFGGSLIGRHAIGNFTITF
ncbi:MAG TPA: TonB-dependent receptor [Bacteroidota bacterium]|nr:TonB-dependent receptor [Bacteroidota bacterium]